MKILTNLLFAFSLLFSVYARGDEARNDKAVKTVEKKLFGVNPMARSGNDDGGLYLSVDFGSAQVGEDPVNEFGVYGGQGTRAGTIPIDNRGVFGDIGANLGFQQVLTDGISVRVEGGYRWMRFDLNNPTYSHIEVAPVPLDLVNDLIQIDGDVELRGPRGGVFLDLGMGNSGSFAYVGSSFGLVNVAGQYQATIGPDISISMDDDTTTTMLSWEAGIVTRLGSRVGVRLGYEWTRISDFDWRTMTNGSLSVTPGDRHMLKVGLFHFFRKR